MISLIEAQNFRCLQSISQPLSNFQILVGPNASGKTTFLDVVAFLGTFVSEGLETAVAQHTQNFQDLTWGRSGNAFTLAIEAQIPEHRRIIAQNMPYNNSAYNTIRYELTLKIELDTNEIFVASEKVFMQKPLEIVQTTHKNEKWVINRFSNGNMQFFPEISNLNSHYKLGLKKSALGIIPDDEANYPVTMWLRELLTNGIHQLTLNASPGTHQLTPNGSPLSKASPPGQGKFLKPDGSNLPWVIENLREKDPERFHDWILHLQTALPDIEDIITILRDDDRHRYLVVCYRDGLQVPSWLTSDGTLRLLALTLPAYLLDFHGIYLIEEPENGIHPRAVETLYQSLSSVYEAQVLLATHSPVILSMADVDDVLCFSKTDEGSTQIVKGSEHPSLKNWHSETNLGVLFAGGVLG